jgi:G3E family GTPase
LNEEFLKQVVSLTREGGFDYVIVENTGVAEPEPVAQSLIDPSIAVGEAGESLTSFVRLGVPHHHAGHLPTLSATMSTDRCLHADTCVTVLDVSTFFKYLHSGEALKNTELGENVDTDEAEALICQVLVNQVEYADVVVLNKTDLLAPGKLEDVTKAVQALNPRARMLPCAFGQVSCLWALFVVRCHGMRWGVPFT